MGGPIRLCAANGSEKKMTETRTKPEVKVSNPQGLHMVPPTGIVAVYDGRGLRAIGERRNGGTPRLGTPSWAGQFEF